MREKKKARFTPLEREGPSSYGKQKKASLEIGSLPARQTRRHAERGEEKTKQGEGKADLFEEKNSLKPHPIE